MDKSYFIYKISAKNKIKEKYIDIEKIERKINRIKNGKYNDSNSPSSKVYNNQAIELFNEMIEKRKKKIKNKVNKICHG